MNKAFIFDWSGTLSDNFSCFCKVCNNIFIELGVQPISENEIRQNFTLPYMKFWNKYLPDLSKEKQDELYEKYIHLAGEPDLHKNVSEIINYLNKKEFKIFILSSDPLSKLVPEVARSGFAELVSETIGATHEKKDVIISLLDNHQLDKSNTFYVGDTSGDVEAGQYAGVKTIGISWGFQHRDILARSNPDYLIDDIVEIKSILSKG